jgi:cobalt/nickel transport protein
MRHSSNTPNNRLFILTGLSIAVIIAVFVSPFASKNPDGLDRVAQDLEFESKAHSEPLAQKLPFFSIFEEYAMRGVPEAIATPLAGLAGTIVTFGLAFGLGKLATRNSTTSHDESTLGDSQ